MGGGIQPTLGGFIAFVTNVMKVPAPFDPSSDVSVTYAYDFADQFVNSALRSVRGMPGVWTLYAMAVYNLAADTLINFAQDDPDAPEYKDGLQYWAWLRNAYGVNNFVAGVVQSTSDVSTSASYQVSDQFANYTIANLQNLKTPYGRQYLGIAGSWGTQWGLS